MNFHSTIKVFIQDLFTTCHCKRTSLQLLSLRRNVVTDAISLPVLHLSRFLSENLVIANPNKMFLRNLSVSLPRATLVAWWKQSPCQFYTCPQFLSLRDVLNARRGNPIANRSPHSVRDDNLYYARNDKNQDGHAAQVPFAMTIRTAFTINKFIYKKKLGISQTFLVEVRRVELLSKTASLRATTCFPFILKLKLFSPAKVG